MALSRSIAGLPHSFEFADTGTYLYGRIMNCLLKHLIRKINKKYCHSRQEGKNEVINKQCIVLFYFKCGIYEMDYVSFTNQHMCTNA